MAVKLQNKHIIIPYIIGIVWFLCHPIISVITGELKCRGIYTDEHQLDVNGYGTDRYSLKDIATRKNIKDTAVIDGISVVTDYSNVCNALNTLKGQLFDDLDSSEYHDEEEDGDEDEGDDDSYAYRFNPFFSPYITCFDPSRTKKDFSIVRITPSLAPSPPVEALVLVIPYTSHWFQSDVHSALLSFMERMAVSPWLAKDILIISPTSDSMSVGSAVDAFMKDLPSLPMVLSQYLIRHLVVLEVEKETNSLTTPDSDEMKDEFIILTQGNFGTVPNLDLVSGLTKSIKKTFGYRTVMTMHPFELGWWNALVDKHLPGFERWGYDLGNMIAFMATFWRPAPHAAASAEGIDSVTVQVRLRRNDDSRDMLTSCALTVTMVEHFLRGLNSLSERLHHNTNQYLLPSSATFVSFDEYIIPAILVMLPLVLRVVKLLFQDLEGFQIDRAATTLSGAILISTVLLYFQHVGSKKVKENAIIIVYILALCLSFGPMLLKVKNAPSTKMVLRSIQLVACMVTLSVHAPLALSYYSLFMASVLFWAPLVAFMDYGADTKVRKAPGILVLALAVAAFQDVGPMLHFTTYASVILVPLHYFVVVLSLG